MRTRRLGTWVAAGAVALLAAGGIAATTAASASVPTADSEAAPAASVHQWLTGYWHNFDNGSTVMPLSDVPEAYNLVAVAFADADASNPGGITFSVASKELDGYTDAQFKADIDTLHQQGRKVILSVGGEKGNVLITSAAAASNFADSAYALMQEYGFDGVDIDLEHGIDADHISDALHQLRAKAGSDLIITMAPQTIDFQATTMGYYQLAQKTADILTIVNMQYYNSGAMMGCDDKVYSQGSVDFLTALSCIEIDQVGLRPDQIGIGVPATSQAAGGGYIAANKVVDAIDCLQTGSSCGSFVPSEPYGAIGGAMTWSINWDATNGYQFADVVGQSLSLGGEWVPPTDPTDPPTDPTDPPTDPTDPPTDPTDPPTDPTDPPTDPTDPPTDGTCATDTWSADATYNDGDLVAFDGHTWKAQWWTQGAQPGTTGQWGVWKDLGTCGDADEPTDPTDPDEPGDSDQTCAADWVKGQVYTGGDEVTYDGREYTARWWTDSEVPGSSDWGAWSAGATCA